MGLIYAPFAIPILHCQRCGHDWHPRREELPLRCPKCSSPYWNRVRREIARKVEKK